MGPGTRIGSRLWCVGLDNIVMFIILHVQVFFFLNFAIEDLKVAKPKFATTFFWRKSRPQTALAQLIVVSEGAVYGGERDREGEGKAAWEASCYGSFLAVT